VIAAVFDTNVVVSGILSPDGAPGRLLEAILDGLCRPVVTDRILAEYEAVLHRPKFRFPDALLHSVLEALRCRSVQAPFVPGVEPATLPDPDDVIFLEAALGLRVPIVTGNIKHYPARVVKGIEVLTPAGFLARL